MTIRTPTALSLLALALAASPAWAETPAVAQRADVSLALANLQLVDADPAIRLAAVRLDEPWAERELRLVARDFDADAFFPEFSASDWTEISRSATNNGAGLDFTFAVYQRA